MRRFKFELEPVLEARRQHEQTKQRLMAAIERDRLHLEDALRQHQANLAEGKQHLRNQLVGTVNAAALRVQANASIQVGRKAQRTVLELAGVHRRLDAARAELIEAARRRRAIELLREKRLAQWKAEVNKAETAAIDELAGMAAARRARALAPGCDWESQRREHER
jgi:flagellar FliJ protein